MESELVNLQRRVAELEAELARISKKADRPEFRRWLTAALLICAGLLATFVGMLVVGGAGSRATAQAGPSRVAQPFEVVDNTGRVLFKVAMSPSGAGTVVVYDESGAEQVVLGAAVGSEKPAIQVNSRIGTMRVGIGVNESVGGQILLKGPDSGKAALAVNGSGVLEAHNSDGETVVNLGVGDSDSGRVVVHGKSGVPAAKIFATPSGYGAMDIMRGGNAGIELGIGAGDAGLIRLYSNTTKAQTILHGDVGIQQKNAQGQPAAQLGVDDNGQGYFMAANRAGSFLSKLSVAADGSSGRVEVSHGGEVKVLMGVLENGKGDVCATGDPGKQVCLTGLAVKSLIPY